MIEPIGGWDVGGANVKAARLDSDGAVVRTISRPFALWHEPHRLAEILAEIGSAFGPPRVMALTMTAELADCFATKREGVRFVLAAFRAAFPHADVRVYGVDGRFHTMQAAARDPHRIAAANWLATASWAARRHRDALLLDVGSTTTDIVPIVDGRVCVAGRTDTARLASGELVYTGVLRTPVSALVRQVRLHGMQCAIAAEHFAIAADAHQWLGRIEPADYTCETPDGRGTSRVEAGARLARMVCGDRETVAPRDVAAIARAVVRAQLRLIRRALRQVLDRLGDAAPRLALVAGSGARLAAEVARSAGLQPVPLDDDGDVAPAVAVASLLATADDRLESTAATEG